MDLRGSGKRLGFKTHAIYFTFFFTNIYVFCISIFEDK